MMKNKIKISFILLILITILFSLFTTVYGVDTIISEMELNEARRGWR